MALVLLYGALAAAALVVSLAARAVVWLWPGGDPGRRKLGAIHLAYLNGGFHLATLTCAVGLHRKGAINLGPGSVLDVTGPLPAGAPPLMAAIHRRLREPSSWPRALADRDVRAAAGALHDELVRRGLLSSPERRRWFQVTTTPLWLAAAFGVVRLLSLFGNRAEAARPATAGLLVVTGACAVVGWLLLRAPWLTPAGRRALRSAAKGLDDARMNGRALMWAVAVRGSAELLASSSTGADSRFAEAVGVYWVPANRARKLSWVYDDWTPWWDVSDTAGAAIRR
ncbi:TIGR04222 domain-containing protein [Asanoa hainanensis]|uniref:TIGR04222 domain-containing protein n=1 Tax=Asanoa hainanensis TaxID=560556 RepID=A0A239NLB2_9ACTN|nr:TIGR04222 domain-containing membrane protein [Asanoa hainanensis]SNT55560.1 TIGR04222 domain-containing protein [Asanoa hainanensis]